MWAPFPGLDLGLYKEESELSISMYAFPLSPLGYGYNTATSSSCHLTSPHPKLSAKSNHFSPSPIFILLEYFITAVEMKQATTEPLVLLFHHIVFSETLTHVN